MPPIPDDPGHPLTRPDEQLVDFDGMPRRIQAVAGVVGAIALVGCVVQGLLDGLTFALMGRWAGVFVVGVLAGTAVMTAVHALGGADRAGRRGERLSAPDVGLSPRRLRSGEDATSHDGGPRAAAGNAGSPHIDPDATADLAEEPPAPDPDRRG